MHQHVRRLVLLLMLSPLTASAQTTVPPRDSRPPEAAAAGTGSISGTVVVAGSGRPARRARVNLSGAELRGSFSRTTDAEGRFAFTKLPAGRYSLNVSKAGHVTATYGQHRPGIGRPGTAIQLRDGQRFEARLQLPRGGALTGTVLDEHAEATPGIPVRAMRFVMQSGQRTLQPAGSGTTDDRGIFRIFGLQPGDYIVCATPRGPSGTDFIRMQAEVEAMRRAAENVSQRDANEARALLDRAALMRSQMNDEEQPMGYAPICFPGVPTTANASAVAVGVAEERGGLDFQLQLAPLARIEGTVMNPSGASLQNPQVTLMTAGDLQSVDTRSARPSPDGRFTFSGVPPGQYTLLARATVGAPPGQGRGAQMPGPPPPPRPADSRSAVAQVRLWSTMDVSIDGRNLTNVMLSLQPGMTISGQIVFDGTTPSPADLTRARVNLIPFNTAGPMREMASNTSGRVDAAGRFTISNVVPGKYRLSGSSGGSGWFIESAVVAGQDTADFPIEIRPNQNVTGASITFTDRQTEFSGTTVNDRNEPVSDYTIVMYPADPRYWMGQSRRIQTIRPGTDGKFTFRNLPPGDYRLATVFDPEPGSWYDPAYLQQLDTSSTRLTLSAGEKKVQDVRISGAPR